MPLHCGRYRAPVEVDAPFPGDVDGLLGRPDPFTTANRRASSPGNSDMDVVRADESQATLS